MCESTSDVVIQIIDLDHRPISISSISISTNKHSMVAVKINHSVRGYHRVSMDTQFDNLARIREFGAIASNCNYGV